MSGPLVIKIGGSTLGDADSTFADVAAVANAGDIPIVVHGGGAEATRWLEAMGIPSRFENGLRVTDDAALPVIVAVYAGLVNKRIVAALNAADCPAAGVSGIDGLCVECVQDETGLGHVGHPAKVHTAVFDALLGAGIVAVVAPIGFVRDAAGVRPLNVNADHVARAVAAAVGAPEAVYLTDVDGVRGGDGRVIGRLTAVEAEGLIAEGVASGGMMPKLRACIESARRGVPSRILDGRQPGALLARSERGTLVVP